MKALLYGPSSALSMIHFRNFSAVRPPNTVGGKGKEGFGD